MANKIIDQIEEQLAQEKQERNTRIAKFNNDQLLALDNREERISHFVINFPIDYYENLINQ